MLKLLLLFSIIYFGYTQSFYIIGFYNTSSCTGKTLQSTANVINQCQQNTNNTYIISSCNSTSYSITICSDSGCSLNCSTIVTGVPPGCTSAGDGQFASFSCNGQIPSSEVVLASSLDCGASPIYSYIGINYCYSLINQRIICKNLSAVATYSYGNSQCQGIYNYTSFTSGYCLPNPGMAVSYTCNTFYPDCYGLNQAISPTTICGGQGTCLNYNQCGCNGNYTGLNCQYPPCFGLSANSTGICSGNGYCSGLNTCSCNTGYSGTMCQFTSCNGINSTSTNTCSGNGKCISYNTCTCNSGFSKPYCTSSSTTFSFAFAFLLLILITHL